MTVIIRPATVQDAAHMARMLNEIIAVGGTTAFLTPVSTETLAGWMTRNAEACSWFVAADGAGRIIGYQSAEAHEDLPEDMADIASFVQIGVVGGGIGTRLFEHTCARLRALGYQSIRAKIRSDNDSGLRYYDKMGFVTYHEAPDDALSDGQITGRTYKRFDL